MSMIRVTMSNNLTRKSELVDSNTTLRTALDNAGINSSTGMVSLNGETLSRTALDNTFESYGLDGSAGKDSCYLMVAVKADNAAKAKINGKAIVVTSAAKREDLAKLAKYRPEALTLTEGEGNHKEVVFKIGVTNGAGKIGTYSADFGEAVDKDGHATITIVMPDGVTNSKEWAQEHIGPALLKMNKIEAGLNATLESVKKEADEMAAAITAE